jgi:hypothetical protein
MLLSDEHSKECLVRFEDKSRIKHGSNIQLDGTPFMVVGCRLMECHQGPLHRKPDPNKVSHNI